MRLLALASLLLFALGTAGCADGNDNDDDNGGPTPDARPRPDSFQFPDAAPPADAAPPDAPGAGGDCTINSDCGDPIMCCDNGTCAIGIGIGEDMCAPI